MIKLTFTNMLTIIVISNVYFNVFIGEPEASFTKDEMQQGKHQEYEKKLYEQYNVVLRYIIFIIIIIILVKPILNFYI